MSSENICTLCPRNCRVNRKAGQMGACRTVGENLLVARAALHFWEEPCISGRYGSGAVFFCGCPLGCVYCQNYNISRGKAGVEISVERLAEIFLDLQRQKAANINLVTPTHYTPEIIQAVHIARIQGFKLPIVYNCSGYEKIDTLRSLAQVVDIYLTDFKYMESELAGKFSGVPDYPQIAKGALQEMVRQKPEPVFGKDGRMEEGVIVRHLLLPGHLRNAKAVVKYVYETYGKQVSLSLMNQYTPMRADFPWKELNRRVTRREYERLIEYALTLGVENGYIQEGDTAEESFIPDFDGEGLM